MQAYEQLEKEFGEWWGCHTNNTVACSSGTVALQLALEALNMPLGSEVIVPDYTMIACARAVTLAGHKPVFVDCGEDLLIDTTKIKEAITNRTKAIMAVHIYGRQCNIREIHKIARKYDLDVIEDLAEGHGITPHSDTDAACWSFYSNKIIAGEEGGMCAFRFDTEMKIAKQIRCLGFTDAHDFTHIPRGINGRLSNANAKLILHSLNHYKKNATSRRLISTLYKQLLPKDWDVGSRQAYWVHDLRIPNTDLYSVVRELNQQGIAARLGFRPMTTQTEYFESNREDTVAHRIASQIMYLPITLDLYPMEVEAIVDALKAAVARYPLASVGFAPG